MPANLVFRLKIWGARDNGIPQRSTPVNVGAYCSLAMISYIITTLVYEQCVQVNNNNDQFTIIPVL